MSLVKITAVFDCDGCGGQFAVGLDASEAPPDGWTLFDYAGDSVRGAVDYEALTLNCEGGDICSAQDDKHLCSRCTHLKNVEAIRETDAAEAEDVGYKSHLEQVTCRKCGNVHFNRLCPDEGDL